jgi:predicted RND superfamily exporter protein
VQLRNVSFDYNFKKFYPTDDEDTQFFIDLRDRFSSDNDFLLLAIPNEGGVFEKDFLKKLDGFTDKLEDVEDVKFVLSITNQSEHFIFPGGSSKSLPYVDFDKYNRKKDSARVYKNVELINTMVSEGGNAAGIYLRHTDFISKKRSDALINNIQKIGEETGFERVILSGRTVGQKYYIDVMSFEMLLFLGLSAVLVVLFLLIAFRSVWGILIPQIVILIGMLWLIGGMGLFKEPINIILTVLPSVMFVVSISDSIHLVSRYLDALRTEDTPYRAMLLSINEVGLATLLTSVTTAVGFFTLYFVRVQPIQVFGIVMGIGVLMAFVLTFVMLPILFYWFPGPKYVRKKEQNHFWKKYLDRSFMWTIRRPKLILFTGVVVVAVSVLGAMQIKTNNYLMDDLNPKEQLKMDFNYMDAEFGGVRPFIMSVALKDSSSSLWNIGTLKEIDTVQQYLEKEFGVQIRSSLVNVLKVMHRGSYSGQSEYYKLPKSRKLRSFRRNIRIANQGKLIGTLMDSTETELLISGVMPDVGSIEFKKKEKAFKKFLKSRPSDVPVSYKMTGSAFLIDKNMGYLSESMVKGLALSILIVALIMGLIYRSFTILLISLVPNLFPLIFIAGVMGYLGVELKTSTAIIFTIAFGIAVDDTIHFMGKFKHELLKGKGKLYALKRSYMTTGKAMILTTLILCSGFMLLVLSSFMGTFYMGVMLCITLFVALIADLTILPSLMMLFYRERNPKK